MPNETKNNDQERKEHDDRKDHEHKDHEPEGHEHKERAFQIQIDRVHYTVSKERMTGAELREVPPTPIGSARDLFEVVPGGPDLKIGDKDVVEIREGERFFTAPAHINPGARTY